MNINQECIGDYKMKTKFKTTQDILDLCDYYDDNCASDGTHYQQEWISKDELYEILDNMLIKPSLFTNSATINNIKKELEGDDK